jgi:hypothetical protein
VHVGGQDSVGLRARQVTAFFVDIGILNLVSVFVEHQVARAAQHHLLAIFAYPHQAMFAVDAAGSDSIALGIQCALRGHGQSLAGLLVIPIDFLLDQHGQRISQVDTRVEFAKAAVKNLLGVAANLLRVAHRLVDQHLLGRVLAVVNHHRGGVDLGGGTAFGLAIIVGRAQFITHIVFQIAVDLLNIGGGALGAIALGGVDHHALVAIGPGGGGLLIADAVDLVGAHHDLFLIRPDLSLFLVGNSVLLVSTSVGVLLVRIAGGSRMGVVNLFRLMAGSRMSVVDLFGLG